MKNKHFQRSFSGEARLAQLAEHYLDTVGVTSSSLVPRTILRQESRTEVTSPVIYSRPAHCPRNR